MRCMNLSLVEDSTLLYFESSLNRKYTVGNVLIPIIGKITVVNNCGVQEFVEDSTLLHFESMITYT